MRRKPVETHEAPKSFTPGPWYWDFNPRSRYVRLEQAGPRGGVVMLFGRYGMDGATPMFCDGSEYRLVQKAECFGKPYPNREHHADWCQYIDHPDARLIAAAPDLYGACKRVTAALVAGSIPYSAAYVSGEDWNPEAHIEVTLTIADARAIYAALSKADGKDGTK